VGKEIGRYTKAPVYLSARLAAAAVAAAVFYVRIAVDGHPARRTGLACPRQTDRQTERWPSRPALRPTHQAGAR